MVVEPMGLASGTDHVIRVNEWTRAAVNAQLTSVVTPIRSSEAIKRSVIGGTA